MSSSLLRYSANPRYRLTQNQDHQILDLHSPATSESSQTLREDCNRHSQVSTAESQKASHMPEQNVSHHNSHNQNQNATSTSEGISTNQTAKTSHPPKPQTVAPMHQISSPPSHNQNPDTSATSAATTAQQSAIITPNQHQASSKAKQRQTRNTTFASPASSKTISHIQERATTSSKSRKKATRLSSTKTRNGQTTRHCAYLKPSKSGTTTGTKSPSSCRVVRANSVCSNSCNWTLRINISMPSQIQRLRLQTISHTCQAAVSPYHATGIPSSRS